MICPFCHAEIADGSAFCTSCGSKIPAPRTVCPACGAAVEPGTAFCAHCGASLNGATGTATAGSASPGETVVDLARDAVMPKAAGPMPLSSSYQAQRQFQPGQAPATKKKMSGGKIAAIAAGVLVVAGLIGAGVGYTIDQQNKREAAEQAAQAAEDVANAQHEVAISVSGDGWDTDAGASRLPVHVVGAESTGLSVNEVQYVDSAGQGLRLRQGTYSLNVSASPIAADGTVFTVPSNTVSVSFTSSDVDERIDATSAGSFTLAPIAALDVTDDVISAAYDAALADTTDGAPDADALKDAAVKRRDDAAAKKAAEEQAAAEEAAREARHVVAASYELDLPEYWDGRVTVQVNGDDVYIYSKAYPDLEVCHIFVQDGPSEVMGDIGNACLGDVSLGGGKYATAWVTNWAYVIGEAYFRDSSDPDDYYTMSEAREIVDIQSGGAASYDKIVEDIDASGEPYSDDMLPLHNYLYHNVIEAIRAR